MRGRKLRRSSGVHLTEFAAVLVFGIPLLVVLVYLALETCKFYTIKSAMEVGARTAARTLIVQYNKTGTKSTTVNFVNVQGFIASSSQFTVTWDTATPATFVTVTCTYPPNGGNGLSAFPNGPLKYFQSAFNMSNIVAQGTFTLPVQ